MCGLWGAVSRQLMRNELDNVMILADLSKYRGMDSTGILFVNRHKKSTQIRRQKRCIPSTFFLADKSVDDLFKVPDPTVVMGHCRAATYGAVTPENAHPIAKDHIFGCHNGTIGKYAPDKKDEQTRSDSHKVFEMIRDQGIDETVKDIGNNGAFALTWVDNKLGTLNFIRNSHRDLFLMWDRSYQTMYWASERIYLEFMEDQGSGVFGQIILMPTMTLHTIPYWKNETPRVITREIKLPTPKTYNTREEAWHGWGGFDGASTHCVDCRQKWMECTCQDVPIIGPLEPKKEEKRTVLSLPAPPLKIKPTTEVEVMGRSKVGYCRLCRKKYTGPCKCTPGKIYFPFLYELNEAGDWVHGAKHNEPTPTPPTSVPVAGKPILGANDRDINAAISKGWKRYPGWCKEPTYVGFQRMMLDPNEAAKLLMVNGCSVCDTVPEVEDKAFFYSPNEFFCVDCRDKAEAHDIRGQRNIWTGTLVKPTDGHRPSHEGSKHVH